VAFVDEIFKANSAILNTLLTLLNERLFDNGASRVRVPLLCLVGASNELPESEELDALYDRFLLRRQVSQVSQAGLLEMLANGGGRKQVGVGCLCLCVCMCAHVCKRGLAGGWTDGEGVCTTRGGGQHCCGSAPPCWTGHRAAQPRHA
jgi:hypothetical protein